MSETDQMVKALMEKYLPEPDHLVKSLMERHNMTKKKPRNLRKLYAKDADMTKYNQKIEDGFSEYVIKFNDIPSPPFKMGMVGMSQMSGKTVSILGLITRPAFKGDTVEGYANTFKPENIYMIGPTFSKDPKCFQTIDEMQIPATNIIPDFDNMQLTQLLDNINEAQSYRVSIGMKKEHYLVIFDDVSFDGGFKSQKYGAVAKIFCNERHNLVSVICTTQSYVDFSKTMRRNLTCLLAYPGLGESDIKLIKDELGAGLSMKEMTDIYIKCTSQPYSYLEIVRENFKPRFRDTQHQVVENSYDRRCGYCK